jgi:hypothetical protein
MGRKGMRCLSLQHVSITSMDIRKEFDKKISCGYDVPGLWTMKQGVRTEQKKWVSINVYALVPLRRYWGLMEIKGAERHKNYKKRNVGRKA